MLCSLYGNHIGDKGASALAAVLKETQITTLKCAAASECSLLCQRPLTLLPSHRPNLTMLFSIGYNGIGAAGAFDLAAIVKDTQIQDLECAAAPSVRFYVSAH